MAEEAVDLLGDPGAVVVKEGIDRYVAACLTLEESARKIKGWAERVLRRA
jgi:hypothetical protein